MTEAKKGNIYILTQVILWSLFPVITILGLSGVSSMVSLFWVNLIAAGFFFVIFAVRNKWHELKNLQLWYYVFGIVIFIGVIFYGLYFLGLSKTTPGNGSLVALFEIVPSYIFFQLIRKEHLTRKQIIGIILMMIGACIVLFPKTGVINSGDWIIFFAVFFPPLGNLFQQKARKIASSETVLFLRHAMSAPILFLIIIITGHSLSQFDISTVLIWLLINGILVFGFTKLLWLEAIHRMTVTKALALSSLSPAGTVLFAWIFLGQIPTVVQIIALPILIIATILITNVQFKKNSGTVNQ